MTYLTIIDYGYGNLHSISKACEKIAPADGKVILSRSVVDIEAASHILLPGVGAFADCMAGMNQLPEIKMALHKAVTQDKKPFLGICVGMQLMAKRGFEHGVTEGLGWIDAEVIPIPKKSGLKIPHMGWNELNIIRDHPLFDGIVSGDHVYFVHSYWMKCQNRQNIAATVEYSAEIPALIVDENKMGMQFHPEKSQKVGLRLLQNFLRYRY